MKNIITPGQIELKIGNLKIPVKWKATTKNHNNGCHDSTIQDRDRTTLSLGEHVSHLGWQLIPEITKMFAMALLLKVRDFP